MNTPLRVVLCADDYGLSPGVNRAILQLAEAGRISATSCMANGPGWPEAARTLRQLDGRIGIGLHLTLTEGAPLGPMPGFAPRGNLPALGPVVWAALSSRLPSGEIAREVARQLARFGEAFGRAPDFIDGHQHVHVLPGIRGPLLRALSDAGLAGRAWLRDPSDSVAAILARRLAAPKALFVRALATSLRNAANRAGFATNRGFSGFGPFDPGRDPGLDMARYLRRLGPAPLVMCHPGSEDGARDPIGPARAREHDYLASPRFDALLSQRGIELAPHLFTPRTDG